VLRLASRLLHDEHMRRISSEAFVEALSAVGFAVYRRTPEATILERGLRAVTIRTSSVLDAEVLVDLRRMAGLSWQELDDALATASSRAGESRLVPQGRVARQAADDG
jgi:hypothetical protein